MLKGFVTMFNEFNGWAILLVSVITLASCGRVFAIEPSAPRRLVVQSTGSAPVIDGHLSDECWKTAAKADGFSIFSNPDILHSEPTVGRVCLDDDYLYIALECTVQEMEKFKARLQKLSGKFHYDEGGVIEVFLDPRGDRKTFQQYLVHANGSSQMTLPSGDIFKILNNDYLRSAATVTASGYSVELAIPLAMLHLQADTGKLWAFNLNRSHDLYYERYDKDAFFSSWNSTRGDGFPTPERFGELVVDADLSRFYWAVDFEKPPQAGDREVILQLTNNTGRDFDGDLLLRVTPVQGAPTELKSRVSMKNGATGQVQFEYIVSDSDVEAKYEIILKDASGRTCYLGGTQKQDLTPRDPWDAPEPDARQKESGFIVYQRPYVDPISHRSVPRPEEVTNALSVDACRGEFAPATFAVYPLRDLENVGISVSELRGPNGAVIPPDNVQLRMVTEQSIWRTPKAFESREHLLRAFKALNLNKDRSQWIWLTIKPDESQPAGEYQGVVSVSSGSHETQIALKVRVLPFELAQADDMGYFMYFPGVESPEYNRPEFVQSILKDMRDHGMTTYTIYQWTQIEEGTGGATRVEVDRAVSSRDTLSYAELVALLEQHGFGGAESPLMDVYSMHYRPEAIVQLDRIYRDRGWPSALFYIEDEIEYPERIARARTALESIRKISPDIQTATALGPVGAAALGDMYDVWIGCSTQSMIEKCLAKGKRPWTYSCRASFDVGPAYTRYLFGRYAWKLGLRGVGLWSYTEDKSFFDRFGRQHTYGDEAFAPEWTQRFGYVVFEGDQVIPSVAWEAVREGINDYRYMLTLKTLAESVAESSDPGKSAAGKAGLKLLDEIAQRTSLTAVQNDQEGSPVLRDSAVMGDPDQERAKVIEAILQLREMTAGGA